MREHGPLPGNYQRIDEESPYYDEAVEGALSIALRFKADTHDNIFGGRLVYGRENEGSEVSYLLGLMHAQNSQDVISKEREACLNTLSALALQSRKRPLLRKFLDECRGHPTLGQEVVGIKGIGGIDSMLLLFNSEPQLFEAMLNYHVQRFTEKQRRFGAVIAAQKAGFIERITTAVAVGLIPDRLDLYRRRVENVHVDLLDGLTCSLEGLYGLYEPEINRISIASQAEGGQLKNVFTHEFLHLISGRTIVRIRRVKSSPYDYDKYDVDHQKVGLRIMGRWLWANEALTEILTNCLTGYANSSFYTRERELYSLLRGGETNEFYSPFISDRRPELPQSLFINAYFENFDPNSVDQRNVPAWKELYRAINESYRPGFFTALDSFVRRYGVEKAIQAFIVNWRKKI